MRYDHKKVDKIGRIIVDSLLLILLWGILALPAASFSIFKVEENSQENVLSGESVRRPANNTGDTTRYVRPYSKDLR